MRTRLGVLGIRLRRLAAHPRRRQLLAVEAAAMLSLVSAVIEVLPSEYWWRWVTPRSPAKAKGLTRHQIGEIVWAVDRVGDCFPRLLTCLPRALAAELMLRSRGCCPRVRIGVIREPGHPFGAHAWLELDGEVLIGGVSDLHRYVELEQWPSARRPHRA